MGAAWRQAPEGKDFDNVLEMVRGVSALGMEVCCTLGMLTETQAAKLKDAGLTRLQPQPGYIAGVLRLDHYHAGLR